ncbi:GNAT family N-acetyltransferase [Paenibacillus kobensis]|uniref:GNAT family N-acetyltransferase n=1 Tax=Paenibacillus kobensis TaxID=59841 RepID=UPI000FDB1C74|nr:GNAT family N-acetyltransferase [Paenibacillus kobensis]
MEIRRIVAEEVPAVYALMEDVVSRIPSKSLFATDEEAYFYAHVEELGEIYGAFQDGRLVAYSVLSFPGLRDWNLGSEFGVPKDELTKVAVLEATVVHESVRGLGLQRLFSQIREQRARESGALYLYSTVHPDNAPSRRNLEEAGLTVQFTRPMYGGLIRHCYAKRLELLELPADALAENKQLSGRVAIAPGE